MKSAERVWKVWVNVGEVEHTSERVRKSAERGGGVEGLWKIVEGLWRVAEGCGGLRRVAEGCGGLRNGVGMRTGHGGVQN